jgi:predicted metalloendopeptidase
MSNFVSGPAILAAAVALLTGAAPAPEPLPSGLSVSNMDPSVKPGDDFFQYSNGGWLKGAVIPSDRSFAGVDLGLNKENEARLKAIVADFAVKPDAVLSPEEKKLRDLYNDFEDTRTIEKAGLSPVQGDLANIAALKTHVDVATFMGDPATKIGGPFAINITTDSKNPNAYVVRLRQSGLGMPNRDYYLRADKDIASTRQAYKTYLAGMLRLAGVKDAAPRAAAIYALEKNLAVAQWAAVDRRDADKTYNPMPISALAIFAPQFPWGAYFAAAKISPRTPAGERVVIVSEKSAFPMLAEIFAATPVEVWRDYLTVREFHTFADDLPKAIDDRNFAFYGTIIGGQTQQLPRDIRGIHLLDDRLGEALGKLYVARYFPPEAKAKAQLLVANVLKAYDADMRSLTWMTPATRARAIEKLRHIMPKIGYPDTWRDYSALAISRGDLVGNVKRATVFEWNRKLARIDRPVDRSEWGMTPPTDNAYYDATLNEIVFPAGILQPPYFDPNADDAVNYGEIGATIGHEISHGFDDQGRKYDAFGILRDWWMPADRKNFEARTAALTKRYDAYAPLPGLHVNGKLTLGENIADLAGLVIAHKAYHLALRGKPAPVLKGLTGDQRFYIAYGQSWREIWTDSFMRRAILSDPHSPPKFRVDGVVRNDDNWYAAFPNVKAGDVYYLPPDQRVRLW